MMQPLTFAEKVEEMKTDDVGTEEYRDARSKEDVTISGETVVKPDVPMYYDMCFGDGDPDYANWAKSYEATTETVSKYKNTVVDPKLKVREAIKATTPKVAQIKPMITNVMVTPSSSRPDYMDGDPDYANFGRVYDELRKKEVARYAPATHDRIAADPDYANFQNAYDRIVSKYA